MRRGAAGAVRVDLQIGFVDLDVGLVVEFGQNLDRGERGVAAPRRIERGNAHEAVNARLAFEVAVSVFAADEH